MKFDPLSMVTHANLSKDKFQFSKMSVSAWYMFNLETLVLFLG